MTNLSTRAVFTLTAGCHAPLRYTEAPHNWFISGPASVGPLFIIQGSLKGWREHLVLYTGGSRPSLSPVGKHLRVNTVSCHVLFISAVWLMISCSQLWFYRAVVKHLKLPACVLSLCICPVTFDPDLLSSFTPKCCIEIQHLCAFVLLFLLLGCDVDVKVDVWWGFMFFLINKSDIKNKPTHTASSCCRYSLQHKIWTNPYWKTVINKTTSPKICVFSRS